MKKTAADWARVNEPSPIIFPTDWKIQAAKEAKKYAYGIGTKKDDAKAIKYYRKANPSATDIDYMKYFAENVSNDKWRLY